MNQPQECYEDVKSALELSGFTVLTGERGSKESSNVGVITSVLPPVGNTAKEKEVSWCQQLVYIKMMAEALPSRIVRMFWRECSDTERTRYFTHKLYISSIDYTGESDET